MPRTRQNFSLQTIKARLEHCGWRCEGKLPDGSRCLTIVTKGRFRCDHVVPDALGGTATFGNAQILCLQCDGVKTPRDLVRIAKAKRLEVAEFRAKPKSLRPLPCGKRSPFKKRIDGTVVLRAPFREQRGP